MNSVVKITARIVQAAPQVLPSCIDDVDILAIIVEDGSAVQDLFDEKSGAIGKWVQTTLSLDPAQTPSDTVDRFLSPTIVLARKANGDALWLSTIHDPSAPRRSCLSSYYLQH